MKYVANTQCPQCGKKLEFQVTEQDMKVGFGLFGRHKEKKCSNCDHTFISADTGVEMNMDLYENRLENVPTEELERELQRRKTQ